MMFLNRQCHQFIIDGAGDFSLNAAVENNIRLRRVGLRIGFDVDRIEVPWFFGDD